MQYRWNRILFYPINRPTNQHIIRNNNIIEFGQDANPLWDFIDTRFRPLFGLHTACVNHAVIITIIIHH